MSASLTIRSNTSPYSSTSIQLKKSGVSIPSGEYSDPFRFRIWNHFGGSASGSSASSVKMTFSTVNASLSAGIMNSGNPPPLLLKQTGAGVSGVVNSTTESTEKNIGFNTSENMWKWFSLTVDGYGSSGLNDGVIAIDGWVEFSLRILVPANAQSMDWILYLYLHRD